MEDIIEEAVEKTVEEKQKPKKFFNKSRTYLFISMCFVFAMPMYYEIMIKIMLK